MTTAATQMEISKEEITTVGYKTKASENLSHRVVYLDSLVNDEGETLYRYTTEKPVLENANWQESDTAINALNKKGQFVKAGFGRADFPKTHRDRLGLASGELRLFFKNKKELGIEDLQIHSVAVEFEEGQPSNASFYLDVRSGRQSFGDKRDWKTLYPVWTLEQPVA